MNNSSPHYAATYPGANPAFEQLSIDHFLFLIKRYIKNAIIAMSMVTNDE